MSSTPLENEATLRARVVALNVAIGKGVRSVTLGGQTITYNTTASLIEARDDAKKQLTALESSTATVKRSRQSYAVFGGRDY